ncbi:putative Monovalent cation/H+ antiporter subunit D, MrpD [Candidatus Nitrotoga sp. BS]|uniref:complex I subunit 5 family protein n=1 Tax=Candidatus Nitrotoga sp. BS TaxID=2890408 RepID=UPI001EF21424|nr:proton-conducting transporter membrane subunit [Candidatus Nitrotoga sp. BS]CAH1202029.1 putative Monovalent cation/H+ antiporter subunit D, MrpD [Candidatus Nitrotoga sp. BS]
MFDPIPWLILSPLIWATLAFVHGPGQGGRLPVAGLILQLALAAMLAQQIVAGGVRVYAVGGWGAPLGIDLMADGLSAVMLLLTQTVALPLVFYARAYFAGHANSLRYFWPLTGYLLAAMNALFLSADVFNIYVTLELLGLAAVGLVALAGGAGPITAAMRYLLAALLGSGAYLLGVALLYGVYGSVSLAALIPLIAADAPAVVSLAAALMLLGLMLKTALFPFHIWLPPAHGGAPAPVSALLSALVIKASFYLILRLWFDLFEPITSVAAAQLLGALGAAAILWGSFLALRQTHLKMLVAYSTVAQIGYLFLLFPLATGVSAEVAASAWQGGVLQVVAHGLAKAAMFAAVGAMIIATGRDEISGIAGVAARLPLTLFTFALAGVTIMGLPPSGGFAAKWLLLGAAQASGQWWWIVVMVVGGLLSAAYIFKVLRQAFLPVEETANFKLLPRMLEWPVLLLALASLVLGLGGGEVLSLLGAT